MIAMRATRRVSAMRVRQKRIAKKKTSIRIVDISDLPEGAMLKVKTQFSTYLIVVVDPRRLQTDRTCSLSRNQWHRRFSREFSKQAA